MTLILKFLTMKSIDYKVFTKILIELVVNFNFSTAQEHRATS